jgi:hypothetical protein
MDRRQQGYNPKAPRLRSREMPETKNYLLGRGERLVEKLEPVRRPLKKKDPYSFDVARSRLTPKIGQAVREIAELPTEACPHNESVAAVTLHPSYLAKTFFPTALFAAVGLEPVGSKPRQILPEKGAKKPTKKQVQQKIQPTSPTADVFVAGDRRKFLRWAQNVSAWTPATPGAEELVRIEDVRHIPPEERIKPMRSTSSAPLLEVVLHRGDPYILESFREYLRGLGVKVDLDHRIQVQGLCFLPVRVPTELHEEMAKFSFLRVAREMPSLRELRPVGWTGVLRSAPPAFKATLPAAEPLNSELRVAVFDGGIPKGVLPKNLVERKTAPPVGTPSPQSQAHGLGVTSALLYGSLETGAEPSPPFTSVVHYRVVDENTRHDPQGQYFDVLNRIMDVLRQNHFDFVNLSLGPDLPIEDDEVHVWTATLDEHFSHGNTLVTVAAGNSGEDDWDVGNARIQAPADGVNMLSVGASDSALEKWRRAPYSSIGPGRSPGLVKPDILAFGGSPSHPFWVPDMNRPGYTTPIQGTSFASPAALRAAIGIRTFLGSVVQPIALKALLIHHSNPQKLDQREVGWGRIPTDLERLITCPDGTAHVLYQGELEPGRYLRARIPLPAMGLKGNVTITATFCYATETDPQDPLNYTRAGLEIAFRPDKDRFSETEYGTSKSAKTKTFFSRKHYATEEELRRDAHKWEPCLKASNTCRASSLNDPVFDIHYNARLGGGNYVGAKPIPYALVVTVQAKHLPDIYNRIAQRYRTQLEPLRPVIQIPIRTT